MSHLIGVGSDFRSALLFQAGSQRLDIIIDDAWLDENQQLVSFAVVRSELENIPEPRYVHQVGDPVVIFSNLILDEPAQNYGCAAWDRYCCCQALAINDRDLISGNSYIAAKGVINLSDLERHLIFRIDQRDHLKPKFDIFVADGGCNRSAAAVVNDAAGGPGC